MPQLPLLPATAVADNFPGQEGPRQVPVLYTILSLAGQSILAAKELQAKKC